MNRIAQTNEELKNELNIQIRFLLKSCQAFDEGDYAEAKRISGILRTLLKDKRQSKSLLGQLSLKNEFVSYYHLFDVAISAQKNFIISNLMGNTIHQYSPNFVSGNIPKASLPFNEWWSQDVITDLDNNSFSREDIVLSVAETDGGAHVDPGLEDKYYKLSRMNSQKIFFLEGDFSAGLPKQIPIGDLKPGMPPVWHTLRQIAHEVIESISFSYSYKPEIFYEGIGISGIGLY